MLSSYARDLKATASIADLFLAGGLSYLSDLYGLVCDNVVNFEVRSLDPRIATVTVRRRLSIEWVDRIS